MKRDARRLLAAAAAGSLTLILAACGSSEQGAGTQSTAAGGSNGAKAVQSMALLTPLSTDPFFQACIAAGRSAARGVGVQDFKDYDSQGKNETQASQMETIVRSGTKAIVIAARDSKALLPQLKAAKEAGATVVAYNAPITETKIDGSITMQERSTSAEAGKAMLRVAKQAGKTNINVVHLVGNLSESGRERAEGFNEAVRAGGDGVTAKVTDLVTDFVPEKAAGALQDALTRGQVDAVFLDSDYLVTAVIPVLQRAGYTPASGNKHILLGGLGGLPEGLKAIRDGWQDFTMNFPIDGQCDAAVRIAANVASGKTFESVWQQAMTDSKLTAYSPKLDQQPNGPIVNLTADFVDTSRAAEPTLWGNRPK